MRMILFGLAALFLVPGMVPAHGERRAPPIQISVSETPKGIRIVYDLPRPATSLAIGSNEDAWPSRQHRFVEPGLRLENKAIVSDRPFRRATVMVTPDTADVDARYPVLTSVTGRGFLLYAPYVLPAGPYRLRVATAASRWRTVPHAEARGGYVVVGAQPQPRAGFRTLTGSDVSEAAEAALHARASRLLAFYAGRFGRPLTTRPTLIVERQRQTNGFSGFRGDVTPNGVVMLRFRGVPPDPADKAGSARVNGFLAHELFHLWNGPTGDRRQVEAWLHEESAEYYSWLAADALWPGELPLETRLQRALQSCMAFGGGQPVARLRPSLRYQCGAIAHWATDVGVRHASGGKLTGFDLWARLLRVNRKPGDYSLSEFRSVTRTLAPDTAHIVTSFLETGREWPALAQALSNAGADIAVGPPTPQALRFAATRWIAAAMCTGFGGAGDNGRDEYFLTAEDCGGIKGQVYLESVAGVDPMADAQQYYDRVRSICAHSGEIALRLRGQGNSVDRTIVCKEAAEAALPDLQIRRALPLNPPARSGP